MREAGLDGPSDPPAIWNVFKSLEGSIAFDIGANAGWVSAALAPNFEKVIAFEPCVESYRLCRRDAPLNVYPQLLAVSDRNGHIGLTETDRFTGRWGELVTGDSMAREWGQPVGTRDVEAVTLESAAERFGRPDFVKVDTEGHELQIVNGGLRVWSSLPRFVIETHSEEAKREIMRLLGGVWFAHPGEYGGYEEWHGWLVDEATATLVGVGERA